MKVVITGATGMVGKGVLLECIDDKRIDKIVTIGRNTTGINHPKLQEIVHADFSDFSKIKEQLLQTDACFFCLGISSQRLKQEVYKTITYDYTLALAKTLFENNKNITFNYVSGEGTDSQEKSRMFWARIKGKTENDLLKLGFKKAFMFRPGVIIPLRGIKSRTKSYQFIYNNFMWLIKAIKAIAPNSVVDTTQIGKAMINTVFFDYPSQLLKPKDIIILSNLKK